MSVTWGSHAAVGAQQVPGFDTSLYFGDYEPHTPDIFLVAIATSAGAGALSVAVGGQPGQLLSLSENGPRCELWQVPGSQVPGFLPVTVPFSQVCDGLVFVIALFGVVSIGQRELDLGSGESFAHTVHGTHQRGQVFMNLVFPGQITETFPSPPQTYLHSLGTYGPNPTGLFHYVTVAPHQAGGVDFQGAFSAASPWAACWAEVRG